MEEFLNLFGGTWLFSRDTNFRKVLEEMKTPPEDVNWLIKTTPTMTVKRQGDKIFHRTELTPGVNHDVAYEIGKEFFAKDETSNPPLYHNKVLLTFDGTKGKIVCESQLEGPRKIDSVTVMYIKDDELITEVSPIKANGEVDTSTVGKRIYKKK